MLAAAQLKRLLLVSTCFRTSVAGHSSLSGSFCGDLSCAPTFEEFLTTFALTFPAAESPMRKALFDERVAAMIIQNGNADQLWTSGVNAFTAATDAELHALLGLKAQQPRNDDTILLQSSPEDSELPLRWDWRDTQPSVVTAVKTQGGCGSCWAFAASQVLESVIAIETGMLMDLSPQQLTSCTPNPEECGGTGGCVGATAELAFDYVATAGISDQWHWPYMSGLTHESGRCFNVSDGWNFGVRAAGITGFQQLPPNDKDALKAAVTQTPVAVSVAASDWFMYHGGVFHGCDKEHPIINHVVTLMGYGEVDLGANGTVHYWLIRNSWGTSWGEMGYMRLHRLPLGEQCGVDTKPLDGFGCAKRHPGNITVCGECGILSMSSFPFGAYLGSPQPPRDPVLSTSESPYESQEELPLQNTTTTVFGNSTVAAFGNSTVAAFGATEEPFIVFP